MSGKLPKDWSTDDPSASSATRSRAGDHKRAAADAELLEAMPVKTPLRLQ